MLLQGSVGNLCCEEEPKHRAIFTYKLLNNYFSLAFKCSCNRDFHSYNTRPRPDFMLCQVRAESWNGSRNLKKISSLEIVGIPFARSARIKQVKVRAENLPRARHWEWSLGFRNNIKKVAVNRRWGHWTTLNFAANDWNALDVTLREASTRTIFKYDLSKAF